MKRLLKFSIIPLVLFGALAALIWVPSLRVSQTEMKSRAALHLDRGDSRAYVETFLRAQHMKMTSQTEPVATANGSLGATRSIVMLKPLLAPPLYIAFEFTHDKLDSYQIEATPTHLNGSIGG